MNRISQQKLLNAVFGSVYDAEFQPESMDNRVMLQKAVFLMREQGISCGDYEFVWDHFGPFSAELSDDMKMEIEDENTQPVEFNSEAVETMERLKKAFSCETEYSVRYWVEAIASLLYLKKYVYPSYNDQEIIQALEDKKQDLRQHEENVKAMNVLKEMLAV